MLAYKLTLNGQDGELHSCVVYVGADDNGALREKLTDWLEEERSVLADGDSITIEAVSRSPV
jgi:hypothetical protein